MNPQADNPPADNTTSELTEPDIELSLGESDEEMPRLEPTDKTVPMSDHADPVEEPKGGVAAQGNESPQEVNTDPDTSQLDVPC